jgi:hypothetical protein
MKRTILALMLAGLVGGALFSLSGCYATSASVGVGVEAGPPAPVYYDYGYRAGYTWIDGHWVWTEAGWQWYPGYWVGARPGYVYIQGYWDYWGGRWLYRPGIWSRYRNGYAYIGGTWRPYRSGYHHYDYRRGTWIGGRRYYGGGVRDHRTYRSYGGYGGRTYRGDVRDHRTRTRTYRRR